MVEDDQTPEDELPEETPPASDVNDANDEYAVSEENYDDSLFAIDDDIDLLGQITGVYKIWSNWAYFELSVVEPVLQESEVVKLIPPEPILGSDELEFVYPIFDYGNRLSTSKASEMYSVGTSMCKLYYTIEKMIAILLERLKDGGVESPEIESQVSFDGHQFAQRKAFESIINLNHNVVVTNFDPGAWGEQYLQIIKRLADLGYGYPPEAPRETYKSFAGKSIQAGRAGR